MIHIDPFHLASYSNWCTLSGYYEFLVVTTEDLTSWIRSSYWIEINPSVTYILSYPVNSFCPSCSLSTKNDATIKIEDVGASICWGKTFLTETRLTITETYFLKECLKFSHLALLQLHLTVNRCCMSLVEISEIWRWTLKVAETVRKRSEFRQSKSWCPKIARSLELLLVPDAWKAHTCRLSLSET
jgi:hypothetical protein